MPFDIFIWGWKSELLWLAVWSKLNRIYYSAVLFLLKNVTKLRIRISRQKYKAPFSLKMDDGTPSQTRMLSSSYPIPKRKMWATKKSFSHWILPITSHSIYVASAFPICAKCLLFQDKKWYCILEEKWFVFLSCHCKFKILYFSLCLPWVGLPKIFGVSIFNDHPWVWPKSGMYTKFRVPRSMF